MDNFAKTLSKIKIPITITQVEMNSNTSGKLLMNVSQLEQNRKNGYIHSFTGISIIINKDLKNGEIKILYSNGKYSIISTLLDKENMNVIGLTNKLNS